MAREGDIPPIRRPVGTRAADGARVGAGSAATGDRDMPEPAAVGVSHPDRASVRVGEVGREQNLVPPRGPAPGAEVEIQPVRSDLLQALAVHLAGIARVTTSCLPFGE